MKRKRIATLVLAVSLSFSWIQPSNVFAGGFNKLEEGAVAPLDINKIKLEAERLYDEQRLKELEEIKSTGLYNEEEKIELYSDSDDVRVIVELEQSDKATKFIAEKDNIELQNKAIEEFDNAKVNFQVRHSFTEDMNVLTGDVKYGDIEEIKNLPNVKSVRLAKKYTANLQNANSMIGAEQVWDEFGYKGEGMVVAVLDTGFQVDHPDFKLGAEGEKRAKLTADNLSEKLSQTLEDDIYYNEKIPTGYDWANMDNDISPVDPYYANHGMHVAGIIGANGEVEDGGVKGIAPEVQIIGEKVFKDNGSGYEDDIIAGINHAVLMGADVINMSLGSDCGFVLEDTDPMQIAIEKASKEGVLVVVSAGNAYYSTKALQIPRPNPYKENYDIGTVGDPGVSSYALSVASMDNNALTVNVGELSDGSSLPYLNQMQSYPIITEQLEDKEYEIVNVNSGKKGDFESVDCQGKVVLVKTESAYAVNPSLQYSADRAGAVAIIAIGEYTNGYNVYGDVNPVVAVGYSYGEELIEKLKTESISIRFTNKTTLVPKDSNIEMSGFSSWGTTSTLDFKPEVTGVGGAIYSTTPDSNHTTMSGTSMSSPQVAGAAAILLQTLKENGQSNDFETVMAAKNILMNNTIRVEDAETGLPYQTRKQGAGLIQLDNALVTPVVAYDRNAEIQKRGAFALKEVGDNVNLKLGLDSLVLDKALSYKVYVDLYTDTFEETEIDLNWDGEVDFTKELNQLKNKAISGASITIDGEEVTEDGFVIGLNGNESKEVDINIDLSAADISDNSFLEGFIRIVPVNSEYNEINVPILGFYGDWNDAKNIDNPMIDNDAYSEYTAVFKFDEDAPLGFDRWQGKIIEEKVTFSPYAIDNLVGVRFTALRNIEHLTINVEDENGNIVKKLDEYDYLSKNTFYNSSIYYNPGDYNPWDGTDEDGNVVKDGIYKFVLKSTFDYEGAEEQTVKMKVKVDGTEPKVNDVALSEVDGKYEISFSVLEEGSGFNGAILFVDNEYIQLSPGETSYITDVKPEQVVVLAFDNARNVGLGVLGAKEVSSETLLAYYYGYGEGVNYENPYFIGGMSQKTLLWNFSIIGPTGVELYNIEDLETLSIALEFAPEQGEPNGQYRLEGYIQDKATGIRATLETLYFDVANNEIYDKSELYNKIMESKEFLDGIEIGNNIGQYTEESVNAFEELLFNIEDIYYSTEATDTDILAAIDTLDKGLNDLKNSKIPSEPLFKKHLQIAVELSDSITEEELSTVVPAVANEFKAALEEAKAILANESATQGEIDSSFDRLSKVMQMLEFKKGDKAQLTNLIEKVEALDSSKYITSTWDKLAHVLANAKLVVANENAMEEEVAKSFEDLLKSFLQLRLKPNKDALNDLINKAQSLNTANYTEKSWKAFAAVLDDAKAVSENDEATEKEISKAEKSLAKAMDNLKEVASSESGINNGNSNNGNGNGSSNENSKPSNGKLPNTGGTAATTVGLLGGLITALGAITFKRKNKR